jgi:hypothetical protein
MHDDDGLVALETRQPTGHLAWPIMFPPAISNGDTLDIAPAKKEAPASGARGGPRALGASPSWSSCSHSARRWGLYVVSRQPYAGHSGIFLAIVGALYGAITHREFQCRRVSDETHAFPLDSR